MAFNYRKLAGRITEIYGNRRDFAKAIGLSERSLSLKMNNKVSWTQREIQAAIEALKIDDKDISAYFFALEVQNN